MPEGSRIFGPGQAPENFLLLLDGTMRVQQVSESGREIVLYWVSAGKLRPDHGLPDGLWRIPRRGNCRDGGEGGRLPDHLQGKGGSRSRGSRDTLFLVTSIMLIRQTTAMEANPAAS